MDTRKGTETGMKNSKGLVAAINWNVIEDETDLIVWNRLVQNFWVPQKIAVSDDLPSWHKMTESEKDVTRKIFGGLTMLDTVQGTIGAIEIMKDSITPHEEAVFSYIAFNEHIHAQSYSSIFATLCSIKENNEIFRWTDENDLLIEKQKTILGIYDDIEGNPLKKKAASVFLEGFLFYSGFFWPL